MYEPVQKCTHCGAGLSLDDLRLPDCKYCKTVFPHRAQAEQHVQVANQMMGQMMQQQAAIQNQWRGSFGLGPMPGGQVGPPGGAPFGAPPGAPFDPYGAHKAGMAQAHAAGKMITGIVIAVFALVMVLVVGGAVAAFLLAR
jgi:hypothetical protein